MEETVNAADTTVVAAEAATEPAPEFAFGPEGHESVEFGFAPEGAVAVDASQSAEQQGNELLQENGVEPVAPEKTEAKPEPTQEDINVAFARESRRLDRMYQKRYEEKLANDPVRKLGSLMVDDIVRREGKDPEEARALAEERYIAALAKQSGMTPAQVRLEIMAQQMAAPQPTRQEQSTQQQESPESRFDAIMDDLMSVKLPEGFDIGAAAKDKDFAGLLAEMPAAQAVRLYHAEQRARAAEQRAQAAEQRARQDVAEKIQGRQALPRQIKPAPAEAAPSFADMTSDEFWAWEAAHKKE